MKANKKAGLLALFAISVLATSSAVVLMDSSDSYADGEREEITASDFATLKAAFEKGTPVCVDMVADITIEDDVVIQEGSRLNIRSGCTLTIAEGYTFHNHGEIYSQGKIVIDWMFFNYGDPVFDKTGWISSYQAPIEGVIWIVLADPVTVTSRGTNEYDMVYNGVDYETVTLHAFTKTPALGTYKYTNGIPDRDFYVIRIDDDYNFHYYVIAAQDLTVVAPSSMSVGQTDDDDIKEDMLVPVAAGIMALAGLIILTTMFARRH